MRSKVIMVTVAVAAVIVVAVGIRTVAQPYGSGYGMMGGGYGSSYGPGYGMMAGYGGGPGMMGGCGGGYGLGWMMQGYSGGGCGPGMMYGYGPANQGNLNLTADQVKQYLGQMIRNPNLKVGDVKEKDADIIVAEIVTKEKEALVQRLDFNRHNGFVQPEQ